jgi:FixJ family two-component response regulator
MAQAHDGPIHVLLTDVILPGASGREIARLLAAARPQLRVLYMSGYTDDVIVQHGVLEPGLAFLQKPFTADTLARRIREVLASDSPPDI